MLLFILPLYNWLLFLFFLKNVGVRPVTFSTFTWLNFDNSERSNFIILSRAKRACSLLTARGLSQLRNSRLRK